MLRANNFTLLLLSSESSRRLSRFDRRAIPRCGERVPYVIVYGEPNRPLIQSVRSLHEVLNDPNLRPNAEYYITKVIIPPLMRCFSLAGADIRAWLGPPRKLYMATIQS